MESGLIEVYTENSAMALQLGYFLSRDSVSTLISDHNSAVW